MVANNEQAFDSGFGITESTLLNQQDSLIGVGLGAGGGAGVGVSFGGGGGGSSTNVGGYVPIVQTPNLPNSDQEFAIKIRANINENSNVFVNGENVYKNLETTLYYKVSDILNEGAKTITIQNPNYTSNEKFVIDVVNNPKYEAQFMNFNININPYDSLIQYQNRQLYNVDSYVQNTPLNYTTTNAFTIRVRKFLGDVEQTFDNNWPVTLSDNEKGLNFTLIANEEEIILNPPALGVVETINVSVFVTGPDKSVSLIENKGNSTKEIILNSGENVITVEKNSENTLQIQTSNINDFRLKSIGVNSEASRIVPTEAENNDESVFTTISADVNYTINVVSEKIVVKEYPIPSVSFLNKDAIDSDDYKNYNINTDVDVPVGVIISNTNKVTIYVNSNKVEYTEFNSPTTRFANPAASEGIPAVLTIPERFFDRIGTYIIRIVPSNEFGDGDFIEFKLTAVDDVWVGTPDIRNISYPAILRGPDYVGFDVDFTISFDTIDTDFVRLYVGSKANPYTQLPNNGTHKLNFLELCKLGKITLNEDSDLVPIQIILTPYNTSGREVVIGKDEIISIQFDKGDLTIPRELAISRIAEAFISQFDSSIFVDETSKYLTHLLHIGNGDNKLVTTWQGDGDSLILKLYEPIDTAVQPNQQVWISKIQANPIVETINISGVDTSFCAPLKGPNFSIEPDNGIGFQIFDDLIASGSKTSTDIINKITEQTGIDTTKLNIQYISGSVYTFENFVHFGSAQERVENFYYKVKLLQEYQTKYISLIQSAFPIGYVLTEDAGGDGTPEIVGDEIITAEDGVNELQYEIPQVLPAPYAELEAERIAEKISNLIKGFDGFENFLFTSEDGLAYPKENFFDYKTSLTYRVLKPTTSNAVQSWYDTAVNYSEYYDKYNSYSMRNNVPEYIFEDYQNADYILFLDMIGQHFDILWCYINGLKTIKKIEHKQEAGLPNDLIAYLLQSMGWQNKNAFNSTLLWEYLFGQSKEGAQKYGRSLKDANYEVWRRILNNLPYLLKHKGTGRAMKAAMACYGVPQSMLTIMEFGGPQDPTQGGSSQFTFDDRTAAIHLMSGSGVNVPWKYNAGISSYPNAIEFRFKLDEPPYQTTTLVSGSEWKLDLIPTTGSFAKLELNFGGDASTTQYVVEPFISASVSTYYFDTASYSPYVYGVDLTTGSLGFPISLENYSNVIINRHNYSGTVSQYEVWLGTSNGNRITTFVSMSILTEDTQWETGSYVHFGSDVFKGNLDEVRLWTEPLSRSKFENHTLFPDAINGNQYNSSTEHMLFRLDFEYPKDRTIDPYIKNVSVSDNYGESYASASNMYTAASYPYQYTPYDRTVTATVPSLGFNYSNKIRFESSSLISNLSHKVRATQKSFDRAPIDSSRLGLFFSPIKELNMDILKAFGDFNIDNYIGDPADEYKETYKSLDTLRHYYFERLDRNIYEYIQLVRYIDKSLFEVLADLAPARAKISKGLLIEPHYLERSKTKWNRPVSERNDFDSKINIDDNNEIELSYEVKNSELDIENVTTIQAVQNNYDSLVDANEILTLNSSKDSYDSEINYFDITVIESDAPFYDVSIQIPTGSSLTGEADVFTSEQIGMEKDSLSNLGFGLYGKNGVAVYRTWDGIFGNTETTGSRKNVFVVQEQKTKKINTQVSGWPTNGSQPGDTVKYQLVSNTYYTNKISVLSTGSVTPTNNIVSVTPLKGYLRTHYKFVNNLGEGMQRSFWKGSQQTAATTPDGLSAVEIFTTNPNILRVAKTGRGSGEPILEVD